MAGQSSISCASGSLKLPNTHQASSGKRVNPKFRPIPVLHGVSYNELAMACADRGLTSLAGFNGTTLSSPQPSAGEVRDVARRALSSALQVRLERGGGRDEVPGLCLRTFPYSPAAQ